MTSANAFKILEQGYDTLHNNIELNSGKKFEQSIFLEFLKSRSNTRFELLNKSALSKSSFPSDLVDELIQLGFLRLAETLDQCVMTAMGIWEVEKKRDKITDQRLIEFIDREFFNVYLMAERPLTPREKVTLLAMIAARAFSADSSVDLKKDNTVLQEWKEIIDKSCSKLVELKLIGESSQNESYNANENPVSSLFRRANELPKKTRNIYKSPGMQRYFLEVSNQSTLDVEKLKYLFTLIFSSKRPSIADLESLYEFCCDIARNKCIIVFDVQTHPFSKPEFDEILRSALFY